MKSVIKVLLTMAFVIWLTGCSQETSQGSSGTQSWEEQYDMGMQYLAENNYEAAILAFTAAIEMEPMETTPYLARGEAYVLFGETENNLSLALSDYETVLELDETVEEAYLGIADMYIRQGNYDSALQILEEGLSKAADTEEITEKITVIEAGTYADSSGHIRRQDNYDDDGVLKNYKMYEYDSEWNLLTLKVYSADSTLTSCSLYEYDESGKLISITYSNADEEVTGSLVYEYNDLGQITMASNYDADGNMTLYTVYEYDENGNQIQYSAYSASIGLIYTAYSYSFDEDGNPTQTETYSANGELYSTYLKEGDEDGNQRETIVYYSNGKVSSTTINLYNSDGFYLGHGEAAETQDSYYNEYGAVAFANREKYKDFEDYSEEEQEFISAMVEAAESGDMDAMTDLLEISGDAISLSYTMWNGYKISVVRSYNVSKDVIASTSFEIRPENGTGYYVVVEKNTYSDDDENNPTQYYVTEWAYTTCPCVNWQWNGEFNKTFTYTTTTEGGFISSLGYYYEHTIVTSGAMLDNLRDGIFNITDTSISGYETIDDTSESSFSYTITYEDGALVDTDNKESFGSYLSSNGTTWISVFDENKGKLYTLQGTATSYYDRESLMASSWLETLYW